jgi:pyruvate/2-oxoglutarate dehydrogenase complex dihydrolipoamide dehydrogenase (E3) component
MARDRYDLVIVGMGSAGMMAAEFAATLGARVAAIERHRVGGDCLWTGCVPSKALLAAAKVAHAMRRAGDFGIEAVEPRVDPAKVFARIHAVQAAIAATDDDPERFRRMGVEVIVGEQARVAGPHAVEVGDRVLETRFVLVATGSVPVGPPIPGLAETGHLTSETFWETERPPASVVSLGGGPISMELGQGLTRLGIGVCVLERADRVLAKEEPELADRLVARLRAEGVDVRTGAEVTRVSAQGARKVVETADGQRVEADEVVVGVGRVPQVGELGLEALGVEVGPEGVVVDASLRTSVSSIFAAGDVAGRYQFTHSAGFEGVRAVRNMLFPGTDAKEYAVPWVTFTDPELAHAGLTSAQAVERFGPDDVEVHRRDLARSDRARAEGAEDGLIAIVTHRDRIVGAHVLAPAGGEVIHELALAMAQGLGLAEVGSLIHAYPTIATDVGMLGAEAAFAGARRYRALARLGR